MNWLQKIWYWCTGQLWLRKQLLEVTKQLKETEKRYKKVEGDKMSRMINFDHKAEIDTKVRVWVNYILEKNYQNLVTTKDKVENIRKSLSTLESKQDRERPPRKRSAKEPQVLDFSPKAKKGGLSKTRSKK